MGRKIYPYVKSTGVYQCPDGTPLPAGITGSNQTEPPSAPTVLLSYTVNENLTDSTHNALSVPLNISKMTAPASTVLLYEANYNCDAACNNTPPSAAATDILQADQVNFTTMSGNSMAGLGSNSGAYDAPVNVWRHGGSKPAGSLNFLAADGHVKYLLCSYQDYVGGTTAGRVSVGADPVVGTNYNGISNSVAQGSLSGTPFVMSFSAS